MNGPAVRAAPPASTTAPTTARGEHGMVVSVAPLASAAGCDVLKAGGNAVDAAIATAFTLAVVWPEAGNIGGGGFMMVHRGKPSADHRPASGDPIFANGPVAFIDYRETAPAAVRADTFAKGKPSSELLAGTPGTVRGLALAYERAGSKKVAWKDLVLPAAKLAERGFVVDAALARSLKSGLTNSEKFAEFRRVYGKPDGSPWSAGDRLVLADLGKTLHAIADKGADGFYAGSVAELIAAEMAGTGGMITAADLAAYKAEIRQPIVGAFRGYTVYAPPPPSSGGIAMLQMMAMADALNLKPADRWTPRTSHLIVEMMRRSFADRAHSLGDPGFTDVPVAKLLDPAHTAEMAKTIDPAKATPSEAVAPWAELAGDNGGQTTHFSVVDADGMAVSNTYTLEESFGGKIVVRGAGFILNNELGDFNPKPGVTTRTGQIGTPPNEARPGKRPLSSMTPTILAKDGKVTLVTGSPGGRTIINTVTQVVLNRLAFDMTLRDAVDAPRLHHQWFPDSIRTEARFAADHAAVVQGLGAMGHKFDAKAVPRMGDAHSIEVDPKTGVRTGVADQRIGGAAVGY